MSLTIGLVGNPNCGKTTVFNALTGARQRVGNWPGVTIERKSGFFKYLDAAVEVVDLPGTYSLNIVSETASIDERIACEYILGRQADVIVNILDASNLERHLYLTLQLLEMHVPVIVAVNMLDVARHRHIRVLLDVLEKEFGCPVIGLEAHKGKGIVDLKKLIVKVGKELSPSQMKIVYPEVMQTAVKELSSSVLPGVVNEWAAMRLLEGDVFVQKFFSETGLQRATELQNKICDALGEDTDILFADARYRFIRELMTHCVKKTDKNILTWTARLDSVVLNRVLGIPIFLCVMYLMFLFAINVGGAFQDFFDMSSNTIFVDGIAYVLNAMSAPTWVTALLANGVGKGINTTVTFIPVIGAMFLFLALLEDSGYMARAAFVVDRLMRALGLPGKSFVPMIVGFGCNVPAVMAARTLENKRDRILTAMMTPFMSCGARLAIYAVFTAAFFPKGGQNVVFALYMIGIAMAVLTGFVLRKTILHGEPAPLVLELPVYHVPSVKTICLHAWQRLKGFVFRAGKLIVPICVLIGALNALTLTGTMATGDGDGNSLLSYVGKVMTPIFAPMGIHQDNWPATVGLVTGVLAKEVVVGALNALYSQVGNLASAAGGDGFSFWGGLHDAVWSIPTNLGQLGGSLGNPILAQAPVHSLSQNVYGLMYQYFDGQVGAMAYLLFVLLYVPCVSTIAAIARELNRSWAIFSAVWSTGIAYGVAVGFYQLATVTRHPVSSLVWVASIVGMFGLVVIGIRLVTLRNLGGRYELARN